MELAFLLLVASARWRGTGRHWHGTCLPVMYPPHLDDLFSFAGLEADSIRIVRSPLLSQHMARRLRDRCVRLPTVISIMKFQKACSVTYPASPPALRVPFGRRQNVINASFPFQKLFEESSIRSLCNTRSSLEFNETLSCEFVPIVGGTTPYLEHTSFPVAVPRVSHYALHLSPRHHTLLCCGHCCSANLPAGDFSSSSSSSLHITSPCLNLKLMWIASCRKVDVHICARTQLGALQEMSIARALSRIVR